MPEIILITGGTSGLGLAMAQSLAEKGNIVYASGRHLPDNSPYKNLFFKTLDVTKKETIETAIKDIIHEHNRIDVLINSAGIGAAAPLEEISIEEVQDVFNINLFGILRTIQQVIPVMRKNRKGMIINVSSIGGQTGLPFQGVYSSTKFALEGMTEALSIELKPFGIHVCLLEPGDYNTNVLHNRKVVKPAPDSPYSERLALFFDLLNNNIKQGRHPDKIKKLVARIVNSKRPKLRYKSGKLFEIITPAAQRLMPDRLFERIITGFYKL